MIIVDMYAWWYVRGWAWVAGYFLKTRNQKTLQLFSVTDLVKTLFAPYRQTFAGSLGGGFGIKLRGLVDQTISRVIGFMVRSVLILAGLFLAFINTVIGFVMIIIWPVIPFLPVVAVVQMMMEFSNAV